MGVGQAAMFENLHKERVLPIPSVFIIRAKNLVNKLLLGPQTFADIDFQIALAPLERA